MTILFINKRNIHSLFSITSSKNGSKIMLFLYNSLYDFLGYFMCVLLFALILHCICPTFFLGMCSPCTSRGLLVPLDSYFSTFMMNWDFGAPYIVQFSHSLTNAIVPSMRASLMQMCLLLYQEVSANFLEQFCISQNSFSVAWQVHLPWWLSKCLILRSLIAFPMRIVSSLSLWSKIQLFLRSQSSKRAGQYWAYFHSKPNVTLA